MKRTIGITLFLSAFVANACGGSSQQPAASAAATQAVASAAASAAATSAATTAPSAAPSANPDQALIDLLRSGKGGGYKVTYTFNMAGGPTSSNQTGTMTQTVKPPQLRQDMTLTVGGKTQSFSTFITTAGTFTCGAFISGTPACFSFGGAAASAAVPQAPTGVPTDLTGFNLAPTSSKTVAGQDTRCFNFTGPASTTGATAGQTYSATGCYTSQGVPLYISSKVGTIESTMTATSFSTTVTDADFALPYPVQKFPGQP